MRPNRDIGIANRVSRKVETVVQQRLLLRVSEAAELLGIGRTLAYDLVRTGDIPSIQLGSRIRVPRAELETTIAARVAAAVEERARVLAAYGKVKG